MGVAKKTRKFGAVSILFPSSPFFKANTHQVKRIIGQNDARLKKNQAKGEIESKKKGKGAEIVREVYICLPSFNSPANDLRQTTSFLRALLPGMLIPIIFCYFLLWEVEPGAVLRDGVGICVESLASWTPSSLLHTRK